MTVKVYRLTTGEDIIGECEMTHLGLEMKNPAQIVVQQTQDGRVGAAFAPFAPFAKDNKVLIYQTALAAEMEVDMKMISEYNRIFGSGIVLAAANEMPKAIVQ